MAGQRTIGSGGGAIWAGAALAFVWLTAPATAADFVMKFGTATINETQHQFIKFYKDEVEKASGGRIEVNFFGTAGNHLRAGDLDSANWRRALV